MTPEQIEKWAREAGAHQTMSGGLCLYADQFAEFARLVAAHAYEMAAKQCHAGRSSADCEIAIIALAAAAKEAT